MSAVFLPRQCLEGPHSRPLDSANGHAHMQRPRPRSPEKYRALRMTVVRKKVSHADSDTGRASEPPAWVGVWLSVLRSNPLQTGRAEQSKERKGTRNGLPTFG